jgi:hypothetical protein
MTKLIQSHMWKTFRSPFLQESSKAEKNSIHFWYDNTLVHTTENQNVLQLCSMNNQLEKIMIITFPGTEYVVF